MTKPEQKTKELSLGDRFKAFKEGKTNEAPIVFKSMNIKVNEDGKTVVLTREEMDRDSETVKMDGMILRSWIKENGIPMIDSHNMYDSVTENGLGAFRNPRIEDVEGKKALMCDPDFAPTPKGQIAKILYMGVDGGKSYFTNVSMGFAVYDYDNETREIKEWEPFEGSLVTTGAVMGARFRDKAITEGKSEEVIAKNLARFEKIHEPFKEFCKLFLTDEMFKKFNIEKDGDLLIDINSLYDVVVKKFEVKEAPKPHEEAPQEPQEASPEQAVKAIDAIFQGLGV